MFFPQADECWEWVVIASENQGMCQVVCQDTTRTWQSHRFLVTFLIQSDPSLSGGFPHFSLCSHRQFDPSPMVCVQCTEFAPREAKKLHQLKILCCLWLAKNGRCRGSGVTENECISKEIPRGGSGMKVAPPSEAGFWVVELYWVVRISSPY